MMSKKIKLNDEFTLPENVHHLLFLQLKCILHIYLQIQKRTDGCLI